MNVCGWTVNNHDLRCAIVNAIDADIVSISETHLTDNNVINVNGYVWFGHNRKNIHVNANKGSGGVGILLKSWICDEYEVETVDKSREGILVLKLTNRDSGFSVLTLAGYLPPENSVWGRDAQTFFAHALSQIYLHGDCDLVVLAADFNARIGSLSDLLAEIDQLPNRTVLDKSINQHGREFIDFLVDAKLCALNGRFKDNDNFTFISPRGKSVVDYMCVPHDVFKQCDEFSVIPVQTIIDDYSLHEYLGERSRVPDHSVLLAKFSVQSDGQDVGRPREGKSNFTTPRYKLNKVPSDFMNSELARMAILEIINNIEQARESQGAIDTVYAELCDSIHDEMNRRIPRYNSSSRCNKRHKFRKPYWNETLSDLWNAMRVAENEFLRCNGPRHTKSAKRSDYLTTRSRFDRELKRTERDYHRLVAVDIETMSTTNPNEFWDKIKHLGPRKDSSIPVEIVDDNGVVIKDQNEVFDKWKEDFSNLYNGANSEEFDDTFYDRAKIHKYLLELNLEDPLYESNVQLNSSISIDEITQIIMCAKSKSACGLDNIPYVVLKFEPIIEILHKLFQLIFDAGIIPSEWRKAIICPILKDKSSDKRVPTNYRGISLLSCISKLYSAFINKRISAYLEENDLLADEQNGFRRDRSCEDHVFTLNSIVRNNDNVYTAFVDLKKAFDFVDRDMLLYKLLLNGIDGKVYESVKSMYESTTSCIRINDKLTQWFNCKSGVAQGNNLSPTIFAIFVNDLVSEINDLQLGVKVGESNISILMYADDILLMGDSEESLQTMLNTLHSWCKKWRVLINTTKSKCVHFHKGRTPRSSFRFHIGQNTLETVADYKYLGVIFNEKCDFSNHCDAIGKGASRALGGIINKIHNMKEFGFKSYEKLVSNCVFPVLDYCSTVWGYKQYQQLDNVQHRAIRYFLGVHRFAPIAAITGDIGWLPAKYRRWLNMLRYWNRLVALDSGRITRAVFEHDYRLGRNNWCNEVKCIMSALNLVDCFNEKRIVNLENARSRMTAYYGQLWRETVESSPKLRTYKLFKQSFGAEKYLLLNCDKYERSVLAQFRCGILPIRVETGRYIGEALCDRLCRFCDEQCIENEMHFLINCNKYAAIRHQTFGTLLRDASFNNLPDCEKMRTLLCEHTRKTAKFLVKAYLHRRSVLYT